MANSKKKRLNFDINEFLKGYRYFESNGLDPESIIRFQNEIETKNKRIERLNKQVENLNQDIASAEAYVEFAKQYWEKQGIDFDEMIANSKERTDDEFVENEPNQSAPNDDSEFI
jgi:dsDNA-specific endonuclease/ATPase MutS2